MNTLQGKVALVTGASRGIGRGIALRLSQEGALVAVHYGTNRDAAEEVVREIQDSGGAALTVGANLSTLDGIHQLFTSLDEQLIEHTGYHRFDILVNNAGWGHAATIEHVKEESYDAIMNTNVKAPLFIIQQALSRLRDGGRIINMASMATRYALPHLLEYSISKGAVNTLTLVLAQQLGNRQITVNAISPGFIDTDMNAETLATQEGQQFAAGLSAFGRWGQPGDVADIAAFLASDDSRWITGQIIDASGGSRL
ncbi:SDR family oxidoreductase [Paenibacillus guangzhouensis]|uniref:SDR family oxidoreductase n=1 Tax=Paenibacillus guangzhouensis TaxID=1473112 RepID=UPI00126719BD|nr:SDR family oxidoreductase [Paenibacillus guangzhouensis]